MKKIMSVVLALAMMMLCMPMNVGASNAVNDEETVYVSSDYRTLLGYSGINYYAEAGHEKSDPEYCITDLFISLTNLELPTVGYVNYVDAIVTLADGRYANVSEWAEWVSSDNQIAMCCMGRVDAEGVGETTITVSYGGLFRTFTASVLAERPAESAENDIIVAAANSTVSRSAACLYYQWTPTQDLAGWKNRYTYEANVEVTGLPYSQARTDATHSGAQAYPVTYDFASVSFPVMLSRQDFYDAYDQDNVVMPKYGLDCSAYLSYCWGITRKTTYEFRGYLYDGDSSYSVVGGYSARDFINSDHTMKSLTSTMKATLRAAYTEVDRFDALVNGGHCMLVVSNDTSDQTVSVREQTTYWTKSTVYTYVELARHGYLPFTMN